MLISESLMCTGVKTENTRLEGSLGNLGTNMCAGEEGQLSPGRGGHSYMGNCQPENLTL